jgi:hypothetical protein
MVIKSIINYQDSLLIYLPKWVHLGDLSVIFQTIYRIYVY